jgi:phosphohistidine phosphatase SixA
MARTIASRLLLAALLPVPGVAVAASPSSPPTAVPAATAPGMEAARLADAIRRGGVVVLVRHSPTMPGVGDPPGFRIDDCGTQRNLSEAGRAQARRLGQWFEANRIRPTSVRASPWCRAVDTAMLAFGQSERWAALSNLLRDRSRQSEHQREVLAGIAAVRPAAIDVYVSHGVTIDAFVGVYLQQGEFAVVRPADQGGKVELIGRHLVP